MCTVLWLNDVTEKNEPLGEKLSHCCYLQKFHIGSHEDKPETFTVKDHG